MEDPDDIFPGFTIIEVFSNGAIRLGPSMLLRSVKQGVFCFSYIGRVATWAGVFVDDSRIA